MSSLSCLIFACFNALILGKGTQIDSFNNGEKTNISQISDSKRFLCVIQDLHIETNLYPLGAQIKNLNTTAAVITWVKAVELAEGFFFQPL